MRIFIRECSSAIVRRLSPSRCYHAQPLSIIGKSPMKDTAASAIAGLPLKTTSDGLRKPLLCQIKFESTKSACYSLQTLCIAFTSPLRINMQLIPYDIFRFHKPIQIVSIQTIILYLIFFQKPFDLIAILFSI